MTFPDDTGMHDPPARGPYRVPIGLPLRDEGRKEGALVSVLVHIVIVGLLLMPIVLARTVIAPIQQGAGGAGPAGGGGGGRGGVSGSLETLRFVRVVPVAVPTPTKLPPVPTPVIPKLQPPVPQVTPPVQPPAKPMEQALSSAPQLTVATGLGPGSGHDGTNGNGPGSGGGVGSGIGPGRGSGVGSGTGGGVQANYPPQPIEFFLPPLPPPASVRGFRFIAEFDVDSTGHVLDFKFSETRDGDYNRRIASVLRSMRFRPGTRPDGTPLRMKAQVGYEF
jgi:periplasmic protein TonB